MKAEIQCINPDGLIRNPAFSQAIITSGEGNTIYIGGQNAVDGNGNVVGKNDFAAQTRQVMKNIDTALKACGASFDDVIKLSINILQGQDIQEGLKASQEFMGEGKKPPVVTVLFVVALGNPDFLLEIDAIAFTSAKP
jgi:enamine deaminase RidA (YjgF/YER057c/UK114 family)